MDLIDIRINEFYTLKTVDTWNWLFLFLHWFWIQILILKTSLLLMWCLLITWFLNIYSVYLLIIF